MTARLGPPITIEQPRHLIPCQLQHGDLRTVYVALPLAYRMVAVSATSPRLCRPSVATLEPLFRVLQTPLWICFCATDASLRAKGLSLHLMYGVRGSIGPPPIWVDGSSPTASASDVEIHCHHHRSSSLTYPFLSMSKSVLD